MISHISIVSLLVNLDLFFGLLVFNLLYSAKLLLHMTVTQLRNLHLNHRSISVQSNIGTYQQHLNFFVKTYFIIIPWNIFLIYTTSCIIIISRRAA